MRGGGGAGSATRKSCAERPRGDVPGGTACLGVTLIAVSDALPHLESQQLVRLCPQWYADIGSIFIYYASRTPVPAKTRAFVDFVSEAFRRERLAERFAGSLG
jgi:DNA-binding transcriptional LysR family regulator